MCGSYSRTFLNSDLSSLSPGDIVIGKVISLEPGGALIDIGAPTAIFLPIREMSINEIDSPEEVLQLNETREFLIINDYDIEGNLMLSLSLRQLEKKLAWERVRQMQAENATVYGRVIEAQRYSILVEIEGLCGTIYNYYLCSRKLNEQLIGAELFIKILQVDEHLNRLLVSYSGGLALDEQIKHLKVGQVVVGTVAIVKPFGAWIDIGDICGLLRIPEISHAHLDTPHSVFKVNDEVKAMILDVDTERNLISLSTKALEPEPGDMLKNPQKVYEKAEEMAAKYQINH
ncbi:S1 RNA-binding domain-containing protein [Cyanobacteria bacterium FACHB-472]|nr:S1 RNA-binding domain-containing protein [Cyanobacteria bacterium FACHB-472]